MSVAYLKQIFFWKLFRFWKFRFHILAYFFPWGVRFIWEFGTPRYLQSTTFPLDVLSLLHCKKCTGLYHFLILSQKYQNDKIFIFSIKSLKFPFPVSSQCRAALPLWPGPAKTCHCAVEPRNKSHNFFCPPCLSYFTLPLLE